MKIHITAYSSVNRDSTTLEYYTSDIIETVKSLPENSILVLPEYCWGKISDQEFQSARDRVREILQPGQQAVLGSFPHLFGEKIANCAVYVNGSQEIRLIPKSHVLEEEKKRGNIENGENPGLIEFKGLKLAIIICADLWDGLLLQRLVPSADILLIPAMTTVPKGLKEYAKIQWYALTTTRSREFIIPIVVSDHFEGGSEFDVGHATTIADPSWKKRKMVELQDFLLLPEKDIVHGTIDFDLIRRYKQYRLEKGIYNY